MAAPCQHGSAPCAALGVPPSGRPCRKNRTASGRGAAVACAVRAVPTWERGVRGVRWCVAQPRTHRCRGGMGSAAGMARPSFACEGRHTAVIVGGCGWVATVAYRMQDVAGKFAAVLAAHRVWLVCFMCVARNAQEHAAEQGEKPDGWARNHQIDSLAP